MICAGRVLRAWAWRRLVELPFEPAEHGCPGR
jgi:hypothetical protein